jgi:hypothetical protein
MKPASRTPEGARNRCYVCGNELRLEPTQPPGDATCPSCGSLIWFDTTPDTELDLAISRDGPAYISIRFRGGAKDRIILAGSPNEISESHGYRYYLLAIHGELGTQWREVPISEYWVLGKATGSYTTVRDISHEEIDRLAHELGELKTHIYEVSRRRETPDEIVMDLTFVREDLGT